MFMKIQRSNYIKHIGLRSLLITSRVHHLVTQLLIFPFYSLLINNFEYFLTSQYVKFPNYGKEHCNSFFTVLDASCSWVISRHIENALSDLAVIATHCKVLAFKKF